MRITIGPGLSTPVADIETKGADVEIREAFVGPSFVTDDGEMLTVQMRDSGFEVFYGTADPRVGQMWEFRGGSVVPRQGEGVMQIDDVRMTTSQFEAAKRRVLEEASDNRPGPVERVYLDLTEAEVRLIADSAPPDTREGQMRQDACRAQVAKWDAEDEAVPAP